MSGSSVQWIVAFVAPRSLRAREVPEDWGPWLHGSHQPQDHRALLIHSGAGGWLVQKGRAERRWFHPTVSCGALLCAHPQDSSPLLTLKDACDEPALTRSSEAGPTSVPPPPQEVPEPPVLAPRMSAWVSSHHLLRLSAEAPGGVITSQAFWVSQVLVEKTDFPCFCGLSHRLRLFCDLRLPLVCPSAWGVPTTPYSVQ